MAAGDVRYFDSTERLLAAGPELRHAMQNLVDAIAADARSSPNAPRHAAGPSQGSQHGVDTIRGVVKAVPAGWEGRVSWARSKYWLYFHEKGWVHHPARPFLRPALDKRRDIR